jgi:hypothetical protein
MESEQRAHLLQRRRMLQLRLEREAWCRQFRAVAPALCARGLRISKRLPAQLSPWLAVTQRLPGRDERIFWPEVTNGVCRPWDDAAECAALLESALRECGGLGGRVLVVFHPAEAALLIDARDLVDAWPVLHAALYDSTWIVPGDRRPWLVEVSPGDRDLGYVTEVA